MIEFALAVIRNHYVFLKINLKSFMQRSVPVQPLCEMLAAVSRYYFYILHGLLLFPPMTSSVRAPSYSLAQKRICGTLCSYVNPVATLNNSLFPSAFPLRAWFSLRLSLSFSNASF